MNRLWVRLSLTYTTTTIFILVLITLLVRQTIGIGQRGLSNLPTTLNPADAAAWQQLIASGSFEEMMRSIFSIQLIAGLMVISLAGIVGSIYASWRMTRPLTILEGAARKAGQRQLRHQAPVIGSQEMRSVAEAFNEMVTALNAAETRRQELLADVSHELRTPLTVLQGNLRAALDGVQQIDMEQIAKLYDQTRQLNHLINDLHDLAQAEAWRLPLRRTEVNIKALVDQAGEIFDLMAQENGITLTIDTPSVLPTLYGDSARLTQVLQNLITNALRYADTKVVLQVAALANEICITVTDDGEGIAPEHLPYIFDRFYRTDSSRTRETGGSGLGLAIVRSLVEAHGGRLAVTSTLNTDTTFTIHFPLD